MREKGWYVYKVGGYTPSYRHPSYESAVGEAQRLFDKLGGEFVIVKVEGAVKPQPRCIVEDYRETDSYPF